MRDELLSIIEEIAENYDSTEDIETKILEDLLDEIRQVLYERASTIETLADLWDDSDGETEY